MLILLKSQLLHKKIHLSSQLQTMTVKTSCTYRTSNKCQIKHTATFKKIIIIEKTANNKKNQPQFPCWKEMKKNSYMHFLRVLQM